MTATGSASSAASSAAASVAAAELRRGTRGSVVGLIGAAVNGVCGFVLTAVIVRTFGTAGSGVLFSAIALVTIAAAVCGLGADTGLLWAIPRRRLGPGGDAARVLPPALLPTAALAGVVAVAGWATADRIAAVLFHSGNPDGPALVRLAFVGVPVTVVATVLLAAVRATRSIVAYAGVQFLLVPIARPLLVGAAVLVGGGVLVGFAGWLVPLLAAAFTALGLIVAPLGLTGGVRLRPSRADWRTFWSFALPRAGSVVIDASSMWVGVLFTSALAGQAEAGVFAAVGRYVLAGLLVMHGVRVATAPQLSRLLGQGRRAEAAAVYRRTAGLIVLLSWPGYLLLAVFAPAFLQLFGRQFAAGAPAMAVLAVAMLVNVGVGLVQTVLLMSGHSRTHLLACAAGLALTVAGCLILVPRHGAWGAALAWSLGIVVENVAAAVLARRVLRQPLFGGAAMVAAGVVAVGAGLACAVGWAVAGRGLGGLGTAVGVLAAAGSALLGSRRVRRALTDLRSQLRPATVQEGS